MIAVAMLAGCSSSATGGTTGSTPATVASTPAPNETVPPVSEPPTTLAPTSTLPLSPAMVKFTPLVSGVDKPVDIAWRPNDPTLFLVQQDGRIVPIRDGTPGAAVLDISTAVSTGSEQGLLGLAFHPTKPLAYVDYTDTAGNSVIAEYAVAANGTFDTASARTVLQVEQPYPNHNGGKVLFGYDGYLYIGFGDGGGSGDQDRRALNTGQLLGKILRIDPTATGSGAYTIPADNPFVGVAGARGEIWSVGLRNPWRFTFDRANGDLWIADVGQNLWEEVDVAPAAKGAGRGANFGWSAFEATHAFNADQPSDAVTMPIYEYPHGPQGCSVSGAAVYRGATIPSLAGWFLFSDYCSGIVWATRADGDVVTLGTLTSVSSINDGPDGAVYVLAYDGTVFRIDPS